MVRSDPSRHTSWLAKIEKSNILRNQILVLDQQQFFIRAADLIRDHILKLFTPDLLTRAVFSSIDQRQRVGFEDSCFQAVTAN